MKNFLGFLELALVVLLAFVEKSPYFFKKIMHIIFALFVVAGILMFLGINFLFARRSRRAFNLQLRGAKFVVQAG